MLSGVLRSGLVHVGRAASRGYASVSSFTTSTSLSLLPSSASVLSSAAALRTRRAFASKSDAEFVLPEVKEGKPGEIPSIFDQATGLERAEIDHPDLFKHNEVLRGPFGTQENPVMIQSNFDARIVGCTGRAPPEDHDLFWINVEKGHPASCSKCGQVFKLDPL